MIFTSIAEVEKALERLVMIASKTTGRDITTARTLEIAGLVGNPQDHLRVIHLAGTSGKTSTSYYIAGLLKAGGMKVGLTVSPHVTAITERVQINNIPLSETEFCRYMSEFLPLVTADEERLPSYFEVMMVFALWVFDKSNVDYAVVETGLGGLHDSSNICRRTDKICIITDIGVDHTHVLGDTIEKIATHKAGIIARDNHVVIHEQDNTIMRVVKEHAKRFGATMVVIPTGIYRTYQDRNFALARATYNLLARRDNLPALSAENLKVVRQTQVPGRFETVIRNGVEVLIDGAHNEQKMHALVSTLMVLYPGRKWTVVLAMKQSKDYQAVVRLLLPITQRAIATRFYLNQDTPVQSIHPSILVNEFQRHNIECTEQPTIAAAVDALIDENERYILVTGSLYALSQVSS